MPRVRTLDPGASPLHFFGAEVRRARTAAGMSQADLGSAAHCDGSVVSRVEAGLAEPPGGFAEACDAAFPHMNGFFARFWHDHQTWRGPYHPWFLDWLNYEREAVTLRIWEPMMVPGLLQTAGYARAIFASWRKDDRETVESNVGARIDRQRILDGEDPPALWVLVDELVLHHRMGTASVMAAQMEHLAGMARRPNVTVQVVPETAGGYAAVPGGFWVATMAGGQQAAYLDTGVQGMTVLEPTLVRKATDAFDALRAEALPWGPSLDLITEAVTRWTGLGEKTGGRQAIPAGTAAPALRSVPPQA